MDAGREKLARALSRLADENPSLAVSTEVCGRASRSQWDRAKSSLNLCVIRSAREHQIELLIDGPRVIYLETLRKASEAEGKYIRQVGGHGNYGHVKAEVGASGFGKRL